MRLSSVAEEVNVHAIAIVNNKSSVELHFPRDCVRATLVHDARVDVDDEGGGNDDDDLDTMMMTTKDNDN